TASGAAAGFAPPLRSIACANSRTSTAEACGCSAGVAAGFAAASKAATWIASIMSVAPCAGAMPAPSNRGARASAPRAKRDQPATARLLLPGDGIERFGHAVLRGRGVVRHELHLQARRGQRDHLRRLVGAGVD